MKTTLITIAAASLALAAAVPALAQPSTLGESYAVPVAYADLNLNSEAGKRTLERRIADGGRRACGARELPYMNQWERIDQCQRIFASTAKQQVEEAIRANGG